MRQRLGNYNKLFAIEGDDYIVSLHTKITTIMFITVVTTVIIVVTFVPGWNAVSVITLECSITWDRRGCYTVQLVTSITTVIKSVAFPTGCDTVTVIALEFPFRTY